MISTTLPPGGLTLCIPELERRKCQFQLAWNPRLLRLNPHAIRQRDFLIRRLGPGRKAGL